MPIVQSTQTPGTSPQVTAAGCRVSDVVLATQAMLGDLKGNWATTKYLKPYLQIASNGVSTKFASLNLTYGERVVTLPAVSAGTTDLSAFMADGQPLADLQEPTAIEWRLVGDDNISWRPVRKVDKIIDTNGDVTGISSWRWMNSIPYISPSSAPTDIRVSYDSLSVSLDDPTQNIIRGVVNILSYRTAQHVASIRGGTAGTGEPLSKYLERMFEQEIEDFECEMIKRDQSTQRRFGRANRRSSSVPWTVPVR